MPCDQRSRTSLTRDAPLMADPQDGAARKAARATYRATEGETVLIRKSWLRNWADRKQLDLLAAAALGVKGDGK